MPTIICPLCDARIEIEQEDAILFNQVRCPECRVLWEITGEDPLTLKWVSEEWDYGDSFSERLPQKRGRARRTNKFTKRRKGREYTKPLGGKNAQSDLPAVRCEYRD